MDNVNHDVGETMKTFKWRLHSKRMLPSNRPRELVVMKREAVYTKRSQNVQVASCCEDTATRPEHHGRHVLLLIIGRQFVVITCTLKANINVTVNIKKTPRANVNNLAK